MQQRRLRPGDILDDYCPRERRVTDHAIVAMVDDGVKQTRCTTCDAEHEYKHGKVPTLRRKKDAVSSAYQEVLAAVTSDPVALAAPVLAAPHEDPPVAEPPVATVDQAPGVTAVADPEPADADQSEAARVHRRLIRATLPRTENQPVVRPIPEFTMHQPQGRPGKFRGGMARGAGSRPVGGRGGHGSTGSRGPVFGRPGANRGAAGRSETAHHNRGHQPGRQGKKHSR